MLQIRRDQMVGLQLELDGPLLEYFVDMMGARARELGHDETELRRRVKDGLRRGREVSAPDGFALTAMVSITLFLGPETWDLEPVRGVMALSLPIETRLRLLTSGILQPR